MAQGSKKSATKRESPLSIRPPQGKRPDIEEAAARAGQSVNAYVLDCVFRNMARISKAECSMRLPDLVQIYDEIYAVDPALAEKLRPEFERLRDLIMRGSGKR